VLREGDACRQVDPIPYGSGGPGEPPPRVRIPCDEVREWELQYGFIGGIRTNWVTSTDVFLTRVYTTYGLNNELFGTHFFAAPVQLLFAYQVDVDL
jgi:hypothetical protein